METKQLESLLAEATPGEWACFEQGKHPHIHVCGPEVEFEHGVDRFVICYVTGLCTQANANLIALAPALAREVIELRRKVEAAEKLAEATRVANSRARNNKVMAAIHGLTDALAAWDAAR